MTWKVNNLIYAGGNGLHNTARLRIAMSEPVDPRALRTAADEAITRYPFFAVRLVRRGEEYVFTPNSSPLAVSPGGRAVALGSAESNYHLFALAYDGNFLSVDFSHFISDGAGSFPFVKTLLYCYLRILHPEAEFDLKGIQLPGSEIPAAEADDDPFPAAPVPTEGLGPAGAPVDAFLPEDQPAGYESRDRWTSFRVRCPQKDMMKYASGVDGSPATFIASVMYRAIDACHPDRSRPIICGMQHQYRKALGNPLSHLCHVNIIPIVYSARMRGKSLELLNTMARGTTLLRADIANDLLSVNAHIENEARIKGMSLAEKKAYMRDFLLRRIGRNTFEASYTGRMDFSGLDRYITDFTPFLDLSLSGGISIEIFSVSGQFSVNIMQRNQDRQYVDRFVALLEECGIACETDDPEHFEICDFVLPEEG